MKLPRALLLASALAVSPAYAELRVFVASGLGGTAEYEERFAKQAEAIAQAATRAGAAPEDVVQLSGERAKRESMQRELASFVSKAGKDDQVLVVFIGHGSFDGSDYRFNVPGPDITGRQIRTILEKLTATQQLVVNATSSSGAVAEEWKRSNRIVITATKSGGERNATRFAQFWVEALSSPEADRDKNETVTAEEAYEFVSRKVTDAFKTDAALATEHSRMEGGNAARFIVARLGNATALPNDAALASMMKEQSDIEAQIDELKSRKSVLPAEQYYSELERILVTLAQLDRRIDARRAALAPPAVAPAPASPAPTPRRQ